MKLSEYAEKYKLLSEGVQIVQISGSTETDTVNQILEVSEGKWIARKLSDGCLYLFHDSHFINMSQLVEQMNRVYTAKGYSGHGYDKLSADELIRYTGFRSILDQLIKQSVSEKLDLRATAESIFEREIFYV